MDASTPTRQPAWSRSWTRDGGHTTIVLAPMGHGAAVLRWCALCQVPGGGMWDTLQLGVADDLMLDLLGRVLGWALSDLGFTAEAVR